MSQKIELVYFDVQGRAFIPRILLRMSGLDWEDTLVECSRAKWAEVKPDYEKEALGALPILRLDGKTYYQTEAIVEWCAAKAGVTSSDPMIRMKSKMLTETLKEVGEKSFMAGFAAAFQKTGKPGDKLETQEEREERNKVFVPVMAATVKAMLAKVEKTFNLLNIDPSGKYIFGDQISVADLNCLSFDVFMKDPEFNKYHDFKENAHLA